MYCFYLENQYQVLYMQNQVYFYFFYVNQLNVLLFISIINYIINV